MTAHSCYSLKRCCSLKRQSGPSHSLFAKSAIASQHQQGTMTSKPSRVDPLVDKNVCVHKHRNIGYRSMRIFILFGKIAGYLPWYLKPRDSQLKSKAQIFSYIYQIIFIGGIWLACQVTALTSFTITVSFFSGSKLQAYLGKTLYCTWSISSFCLFGYCILFSKKFITVFQQWRLLDNIIGKTLRTGRLILAQSIIAIGLLLYLIVTIVYTVWEINLEYEDEEWTFVGVLFLLAILFYFAFNPVYKCFTMVYFTFSCWLFSTAYGEIQNELGRIKESPAKDFTENVYKMRKRERTVHHLVSETNNLFALPVTVIFMESCILTLISFYTLVDERDLLSCVDVVIFIVPMIAIAMAADHLSEKHKKLLQDICDFEIDPKEIDLKEQLQLELLKEKLSKCKVEFSACGFFTINRALMTTIFGAILSYLIILAEFRKDSSLSNKKNITSE